MLLWFHKPQIPQQSCSFQLIKKSIDESGITWILNPYAEFAIEKALKLKKADSSFAEIILIAMGPQRTQEALRQGLAMGADRAIFTRV